MPTPTGRTTHDLSVSEFSSEPFEKDTIKWSAEFDGKGNPTGKFIGKAIIEIAINDSNQQFTITLHNVTNKEKAEKLIEQELNKLVMLAILHGVRPGKRIDYQSGIYSKVNEKRSHQHEIEENKGNLRDILFSKRKKPTPPKINSYSQISSASLKEKNRDVSGSLDEMFISISAEKQFKTAKKIYEKLEKKTTLPSLPTPEPPEETKTKKLLDTLDTILKDDGILLKEPAVQYAQTAAIDPPPLKEELALPEQSDIQKLNREYKGKSELGPQEIFEFKAKAREAEKKFAEQIWKECLIKARQQVLDNWAEDIIEQKKLAAEAYLKESITKNSRNIQDKTALELKELLTAYQAQYRQANALPSSEEKSKTLASLKTGLKHTFNAMVNLGIAPLVDSNLLKFRQ